MPIRSALVFRPVLYAHAVDKINNKSLLVVVKVLISGGLIAWLLSRSDLEAIFATIKSADPLWLTAAFLVFFVGYFITAHRWRLLLAAQQIYTHVWRLVQSFSIAIFFNNFLPSTIGGDAYRMYEVWRLGANKTTAVSVIFIDRFLGLFALLAYALIASFSAVPLSNSIPGLSLYIAAVLLAMTLFVWLVFGSGGRLTQLVSTDSQQPVRRRSEKGSIRY